jgi:hypothetical protein
MDDSKSCIAYYDDKYSYSGNIKKIGNYLVADGNGRLDWSNNIYIGNFKNNCFDGKGKCVYNSGLVYEGFWKENLKNGFGKLKFKNGLIYEGNFDNDKISGLGKLYFEEKIIYNGEWVDNIYNGFGIYYYPNGKIQFQGYNDDFFSKDESLIFNRKTNNTEILFNEYNQNNILNIIKNENLKIFNIMIPTIFTPSELIIDEIFKNDNVVSTTAFTMKLLKKIKRIN